MSSIEGNSAANISDNISIARSQPGFVSFQEVVLLAHCAKTARGALQLQGRPALEVIAWSVTTAAQAVLFCCIINKKEAIPLSQEMVLFLTSHVVELLSFIALKGLIEHGLSCIAK